MYEYSYVSDGLDAPRSHIHIAIGRANIRPGRPEDGRNRPGRSHPGDKALGNQGAKYPICTVPRVTLAEMYGSETNQVHRTVVETSSRLASLAIHRRNRGSLGGTRHQSIGGTCRHPRLAVLGLAARA